MRARRRDRRVYLGSHPVLFALLALSRCRPVLRLGGTLLVHDRAAYLAALTRVPLDRTAAGTTGGVAAELTGGELLFDQHGGEHRRARRALADALGASGVARLRPVWTAVLARGLAPLADGGEVDLVPVAAELAGVTAAALLGVAVDPLTLADAAREAGATAARAHLPGPGRRRAQRAARRAATRLTALTTPGGGPPTGPGAPGGGAAPTGGGSELAGGGAGLAGGGAGLAGGGAGLAGGGAGLTGGGSELAGGGAGLAAMLAAAAVNTTVSALPRAAAWAADADLWRYADRPALVDELLRVTAPTPLLPRVAAGPGDLGTTAAGPGELGTTAGPGGCPVRAGDRLLLVTRHAADAHRSDPDPVAPAPPQVAQVVFGAGPHACPGARLARAQLADLLAALAPYRPEVVRARVDRRSALPGWRSLVVRPTR
ncbi:cytochrome P450 [Krasilnikovia cinnamomea]|uniref:Cytochrome P450 n=1 Tax=Krasilnikovia cinnamomea TaxID=349313 RepID=A0A4V2G6K6_9ACTN|nr:cytochrome P450 [Krasilnikovia cinnamomea]RZU49086.1 cytochrome P450 [Krasilnikovia cinnamomea]